MPTNPDKNQVINNLLMMNEALDNGIEFFGHIEHTPFEDVTPELWASMRRLAPFMVNLLDTMKTSSTAVGAMIDDEEGNAAMEVIGKQLEETLENKARREL